MLALLAVSLLAGLVTAAVVIAMFSRARGPSSPSSSASRIFVRSQLGGKSVINYCYTDFPWMLVAKDIAHVLRIAWALPYIVCPIWPQDSDDLDELSPTLRNIFCIVVHLVLFLLQFAFLLSLPFLVLFPLWMVVIGCLAGYAANYGLCMLLNPRHTEYTSDPQYAPELPEHAHERWIFLNGVAVGEHWLKGNLNRLALTFKRPILGIHNRTSGILFDIIECLVQRNFAYATTDVRVAYSTIKETLYNPRYSRVILVLHSQGCILGGLTIDWLLQELPQDLLAKLEVYTFGNAANHFNNPHRYASSQRKTLVPLPGAKADASSPADGAGTSTAVPRLITETSSSHPSDISGRVIGHIEHYANMTDFVALLGVLHFASSATASPMMPRYIGRVFAWYSTRGGHQFNQHYLDGMFPLARDDRGRLTGCAETGNEFMESAIMVGEEGDEGDDVDEAYGTSWLGALGGMANGRRTVRSSEANVKIHNGGSPIVSRKGTMSMVKVKDVSRLWQYRNGRRPQDEQPPLLHQEPDGVVRGATM